MTFKVCCPRVGAHFKASYWHVVAATLESDTSAYAEGGATGLRLWPKACARRVTVVYTGQSGRRLAKAVTR